MCLGHALAGPKTFWFYANSDQHATFGGFLRNLSALTPLWSLMEMGKHMIIIKNYGWGIKFKKLVRLIGLQTTVYWISTRTGAE